MKHDTEVAAAPKNSGHQTRENTKTNMPFAAKEIAPLALIPVLAAIIAFGGDNSVDIIGAIATVLSMATMLPQGLRILRMRNDRAALQSVSVPTYTILISSASLWVAYGLMDDSIWVALSLVLNIPIGMAVLFIIARSRMRNTTTALTAQAGGGWPRN